MTITQEQLKRQLSYNPETGVFRWLVAPNGRIAAGDIAGSMTNRGYLRISVGGQRYLAHRLALIYMNGACGPEVDHIDGDRSNNVIGNLREVDRRQNGKNRRLSEANTSGVTGVYPHRATGKWKATITVDYKTIYLGLFATKAKAIDARKQAERRYGFHENHGSTR